jgi:sugar-specific transcriptional regulator TrmB
MLKQIDLKNNLSNLLKEIGLTDQEANLYTASLVLGPTSIAKLALHLAMPRPNVYKLIAGLEKQGLAIFSERKRMRKTFMVEPPTVVVKKLREKRDVLSRFDNSLINLMPDLLALYHQGETPTKIKVIEGEEQYSRILFQIFDEVKGELLYFGSVDDFVRCVSKKTFEQLTKIRMEKGIKLKSIFLSSDLAVSLQAASEKELRLVKILPTDTLPFSCSFQLSDDKVMLWQPNAPLALIIEDQYIVKMLKRMFQIIWGSIV